MLAGLQLLDVRPDVFLLGPGIGGLMAYPSGIRRQCLGQLDRTLECGQRQEYFVLQLVNADRGRRADPLIAEPVDVVAAKARSAVVGKADARETAESALDQPGWRVAIRWLSALVLFTVAGQLLLNPVEQRCGDDRRDADRDPLLLGPEAVRGLLRPAESGRFAPFPRLDPDAAVVVVLAEIGAVLQDRPEHGLRPLVGLERAGALGLELQRNIAERDALGAPPEDALDRLRLLADDRKFAAFALELALIAVPVGRTRAVNQPL